MPNDLDSAPLSPCVNICSLDGQGFCRGCMRTRDEIAGWIRMSAEQQWSVVRACDERRLARFPAPAPMPA
jgi:predicted Fe-S protein YdhL (DUF1289 family)